MKEETLRLMEDQMARNLEEMKDLNWIEDSTKRKALMAETMNLADRIIAEEHENYEFYDKEDRRALEREKLAENSKVENMKADVNWKRMVLETAKIVVPVIIPLFAYDKFQKRMLKFEETGHISSTAGRELHLPKIFNK